jgi:hypothetical protein
MRASILYSPDQYEGWFLSSLLLSHLVLPDARVAASPASTKKKNKEERNDASPSRNCKSKGTMPAPPHAAWRGAGRAGCAPGDSLDVGAAPAVDLATGATS